MGAAVGRRDGKGRENLLRGITSFRGMDCPPSFFSNRYISPRYESKIYHHSLPVLVEKFGGGDVDALIISFCWSVLLVALSVYMYMRVNLRRGECDG